MIASKWSFKNGIGFLIINCNLVQNCYYFIWFFLFNSVSRYVLWTVHKSCGAVLESREERWKWEEGRKKGKEGGRGRKMGTCGRREGGAEGRKGEEGGIEGREWRKRRKGRKGRKVDEGGEEGRKGRKGRKEGGKRRKGR